VTSEIETMLRVIGVRCAVERRGTLAVLTPAPGERGFERPEVRREVLSILRAHGFTHAAVETGDDDGARA
jgi:hypothetical protein